jgi:hypothetical protein
MRERLRRLAKLETAYRIGEPEGAEMWAVFVSPGPNGPIEGDSVYIGRIGGERRRPVEPEAPITRGRFLEIMDDGSRFQPKE